MTTTTNIGLSAPAHGANVDTWDVDPINNNSGILDAIFGSVTTKSLTNAPVTLSSTESQVNILRFTGTLGANVTITLGAIIKSWICENLTLGVFSVIIQGSPGTGNKVGLPPGSSQIYWDGTNVGFVNLPPQIGAYEDFAGETVPAWVTACTVPPFLYADGSTFSAVTYPLLNKVLGGNTLPDTRGRLRATLDNSTNRITTAGSGIDGSTRFAAGGAQNVTLTALQMPVHTHGITQSPHDHGVTGGTLGGSIQTGTDALGGNSPAFGGAIDITPANADITINNAGGGDAHTNMPPTYIGGITMIRAA